MSLPLRERGLKFRSFDISTEIIAVAPFAGAWIEMLTFVGITASPSSLPLRERGLKFYGSFKMSGMRPVAPFAGAWIEICQAEDPVRNGSVAPFAGAWIEINPTMADLNKWLGRSLCGSVD